MINDIKKALIVAPHPDDETLGCAGTILRLKNEGKKIYWLIVTKGYLEDGFNPANINNKEHQITKVTERYQFDGTSELGLRTTYLDSYPIREVIDKINEVISSIKPDAIFLPHRNDVHSDHKVVFDATWSCSKSFRSPFIKAIYSYETVSETEYGSNVDGASFVPNVYIDISNYYDEKINIAKLYSDELGDTPFPRSIDNMHALSKFRGSSAFVDYAEAFMCLKYVI